MDSDRLCEFFNRLQGVVGTPAQQALVEIGVALRRLDSVAGGARFVLVRSGVAGVILRLDRLPAAERYSIIQGVLVSADTAALIRTIDAHVQHRAKVTDPRVKTVLRRVQEQFHSPAKSQLGYLARSVKLSPWYLSKLVHQQTGRHLTDHVRRARVAEAARQLLARPRPLRELAHAVGYGHESDLCKNFKLVTGCSPREYIRLGQ